MCGIAGILKLHGSMPTPRAALEGMSRAMELRGPDDEGFLVASLGEREPLPFRGSSPLSPERAADPRYPREPLSAAEGVEGSLFLVHRRLSILDLSPSGHQPMGSPDGRHWIVYNGEIYNYRELREELRELGVELRSDSDTEVLLHAYRTWGPDCLKRCNGMFALAIWDEAEKTLFCARDRVGIKPFYYVVSEGLFLFASDVQTLIASGLYRPQLDLQGLYYGMSFGVAPRPMTMFEGVRALEQAHWMKVHPGGRIERERYWRVPTCVQDAAMSEPEAVALIGSKLEAAVARRLVSDVPVGTMMSGGIDSTTVSAMASRGHPGIKAFTLVFDDYPRLNELPQAKATAAMHPLQHVTCGVRADATMDVIGEMVECYEEPFYDLSPNYLMTRRIAEEGVTVVLMGLGGDELFGGYPYYRWENRWKLLRAGRPLLEVASRLPWVGHLGERLLAMGQSPTPEGFGIAARCFMTDREKQRLFGRQADPGWDTVETIRDLYVGQDVEFTDAIEAIGYIDLLNYIGNHHVYRVDKFTMRFSLEGRLPLLDHELIEAAARVPSKLRVHPDGQKYVLRQVARGRIHDSCFEMRKKGFDLPTDEWLRGPLAGLLDDKWSQLQERGWFQADELSRIRRDWLTHGRSYRGVWQLVAIELWAERFLDASPAPCSAL